MRDLGWCSTKRLHADPQSRVLLSDFLVLSTEQDICFYKLSHNHVRRGRLFYSHLRCQGVRAIRLDDAAIG
jgi:hypothetical protein